MLRAIPVGETTNYGALAARLGTRDAREVTEAIARNPIAVLVPCHRVIKKDGSISGYRWGFKRKRELLMREQRPEGRNSCNGPSAKTLMRSLLGTRETRFGAAANMSGM
jgi:O-6-methylguanine DNA methyltransferase